MKDLRVSTYKNLARLGAPYLLISALSCRDIWVFLPRYHHAVLFALTSMNVLIEFVHP